MATIYIQGSRGEEVKRIQQMLAKAGYWLTADGDYGPKTVEAVKAFQRKEGLTPVDGVVGPATMARLTAKSGGGPVIVKNPINTHITCKYNRTIRYIAIHYTAGRSSRKGSAIASRNAFLTRQASADFIVDDEQTIQVNPEPKNYYCWAVGDKKNSYSGGGKLFGIATNKNTVSIEICSTLKDGTSASVPNHEGWSFSAKALNRASELVRYLMREYNIPKENVVRHYDISGKLCPGVPGWNDAPLYTADGKKIARKNDSGKWEQFKAGLSG